MEDPSKELSEAEVQLEDAELSQPNLTVAVTKRWTGTHPPPPHHKLLTANISAISQPIELKFFLVTLQWVLAMSRLQKILSSS